MKQELLKLYDIDLEELITIAEKITKENFPKKDNPRHDSGDYFYLITKLTNLPGT